MADKIKTPITNYDDEYLKELKLTEVGIADYKKMINSFSVDILSSSIDIAKGGNRKYSEVSRDHVKKAFDYFRTNVLIKNPKKEKLDDFLTCILSACVGVGSSNTGQVWGVILLGLSFFVLLILSFRKYS